jgi:hypothetical protein
MFYNNPGLEPERLSQQRFMRDLHETNNLGDGIL